jgi:hypothetical protein
VSPTIYCKRIIKWSQFCPALSLRRSQGLARLDPDPGAHQPLRARRQLVHQHRHLLLERREVLGHHAGHHEDQGTELRRLHLVYRRRSRPEVSGRHRGDGSRRAGRQDDDGQRISGLYFF